MKTADELAKNLYKEAFQIDMLLNANYAYDTNGNIEYCGYAAPGIANNETGWLIFKFTYGTQGIETKRHADANPGFDKIWDSRASYTY